MTCTCMGNESCSVCYEPPLIATDPRLIWPSPDELAERLAAARVALRPIVADDAWLVYLDVTAAGWELRLQRAADTRSSATLPRHGHPNDLRELALQMLEVGV